MVYGIETVAVTKKQMEEMEVAEIKILRFAMGMTRKDKIRNEYIRGTVKVERLVMKMREGRLRWYGYVMRRDQEYVGRRAIEMVLPGKRKRGRPKRRFLDVVKEDMRKLVQGGRILKTRRCGKTSYAVATSDQRKKPKEEEVTFKFEKKNSTMFDSVKGRQTLSWVT